MVFAEATVMKTTEAAASVASNVATALLHVELFNADTEVTGHFGPKTLRYQDTSAPMPKCPEDTSALVPKCPDSSAPSHFGTKTFRH